MSPAYRRLLATAAAGAAAIVGLLVVVAAGPAVAGETKAEKQPEQQGRALKQVAAKKVCMVNDQVFERDQIPVEVQGKTYYGCCMMCKERLTKDAEARTGVDPVTGKRVDKATAVIAARADGTVLYFESDKTLAEFQKKSKQQK